jgi:hypothetical protein
MFYISNQLNDIFRNNIFSISLKYYLEGYSKIKEMIYIKIEKICKIFILTFEVNLEKIV